MQKKSEHQEDLWTGQVKSRTASEQFVLILDSKSKIRRTSRVRKSGKRPCTACVSVRRQLGVSEA